MLPEIIQDTIKISVGVVATVFLTTFLLGIINGATGNSYSAQDIPVIGFLLRATDSGGKALGERMGSNPPSVTV